MASVDVTVYHLEMFARPTGSVSPPRKDVVVMQAHRPTLNFYRFLYHAVGKDYNWRSRAKLSDEVLAAVIHHSHNEVHVLYVAGNPAGFVEFNRRVEGEVEIVQFGLLPEFIGQGLGKYFLRWAIDYIWDSNPRRLWLHTCTLDHPIALPNYQKAGFVIFKEVVKREEVEWTG